MKKFNITVETFERRTFEVEAENEKQAYEIAEEEYWKRDTCPVVVDLDIDIWEDD